MKRLRTIGSILLLSAVASCTTPGPVTARPDPNVMTSGTAGSVKATDRPPGLPVVRDTARRDTLHNR